jgi:hypothetical protein
MAKRKGVKVTVVDVDRCGRNCDWVTYTPLIKVNGREVQSYREIIELLK